MIINLRLYKAIIPSIKILIENNPNVSDPELLGICSTSTGAPVIACAYYVAHLKGMNDTLKNSIEIIRKFYRIEDVQYIEEFLSV